MNKDNNKNLIYVSLKQVAQISGKSLRTIQRYCTSGKLKFRIVEVPFGNKKQFEILVSSLEEELQAKIKTDLLINTSKAVTCVSPSTISFEGSTTQASLIQEPSFSLLDNKEKETLTTFGLINNKSSENYVIPEDAKRIALAKVDLIMLWQNFRNNAKSKTVADKKFINLYNSKQYNKYLYEQLGKISIRTLARWHKTYVEANNDWQALINNYSYGCESQLITDLADIEKYYLLKFMLHQNKFNIGKAYELIIIELKAKGISNISSLSAYRRVWQYVVTNYAEMVAFARGGMKSALDTQLPHITKDLTKLNVGDVIVGDGHTLDFMVLNPLTNKPCRATLVINRQNKLKSPTMKLKNFNFVSC